MGRYTKLFSKVPSPSKLELLVMSQQAETQKLITISQRRLQILKEQRALKGINTEPHILIEIEDLEAEIAKLQAKLEPPENSSTTEEPQTIPPKLAEDTNPKARALFSTASDPPRQSQDVKMPTQPQVPSSYALVMKGGGIKGLAYVGALEELQKHYTFNWFIGTSAGAIAAVLLAAGYTVGELKDILYKKDFRDFLDAKWYERPWNFVTQGGIHPAYKFTDWIDDLLAQKLKSRTRVRLKDLKYRVTIYASRRDEDALIFDSDDPKTQDTPAAHAVRCSMSIPFIFTPQMRDGMRVLDGGMRHNYPIDILLSGHPDQDFVGLYLGPETYEGRAKPASLIGDLLSIWTEARDDKALRQYGHKTVVIDPRPIGTVDFGLDDEEKDFLLAAGRAAARKFLSGQDNEDENEKIKQGRHQINQKRIKQRRRRMVVGIIAALVIALAIIVLTMFVPDDPPTPPTPTQTEEAAAKAVLTSTPTLPATSTEETAAVPSPTESNPITPSSVPSSVTPNSSPITYSGNLAIPLISGLSSKVYLTSFDGQGINGPNPVSLDAQQPMISLNGRSILVKATMDGKSGIHKLTASGFNPELSVERPSAEWPVLSPDGATMMFSETTLDSRLHIRKPDGTIEELFLKDGSSLSAKNLLWSEDNQLIFQGCAAWLSKPDSCGIWITNVNNLEPRLVVENKAAYPMSVRGDLLAYMSFEGGDWEIYSLLLKGGPAVKLTNNDFEDGLPAISPDGDGIAYISNESGAWGLWTMSLDGQNKKHRFDIDPGRGTIDIDQWSKERMGWRR